MRKFITALVACTTLLGAGAPTGALAAPPRTEAEASQQVNAWLIANSQWVAGYNQISTELFELLTAVNAGIADAREYGASGNTSAGRAWVQPWAEGHRAKLAELKARLAALPRTSPGLKGPNWDVASLPGSRQSQAMFDAAPGLSERELAYGEKLVNHALPIIEAAAGGNERAIEALRPLFFDLNAASLDAANKLNAVFLPQLEQDRSPKASAVRASIALNEALITTYRLIRDEMEKKASDRAAGAAAVRANADQIDTAVREMGPRARALANVSVGALDRKFEALIGNYDQTGVALTDLAGRLRSLAAELAAGDRLDVDRTLDALEAMDPSINRFFELDAQRTALMRQ